jgi:hypothetical protein
VQVADRIGVTTHTASAGQDFPKYSVLQRLGSALGYDARRAEFYTGATVQRIEHFTSLGYDVP